MSLRSLSPRRTSLAALVLLTGSATVVAGAGVPAVGSPGPDRADAHSARTAGLTVSAPARLSDGLRARAATSGRLDAAARTRQVLDYWTPERMREATPYAAVERATYDGDLAADLAAARESGRASAQPTRTVARASEPAAGTTAERRVRFSNKVGKVFFTQGGADYVCSGSAVSTGSKRIVATAGHCVHGGRDGSFHTNWMYEAGFSQGGKPGGRGRFVAHTFRTFREWVRFGGTVRGLNSDVAFVTTNRNPVTRKRLVSAYGGMGLATGGRYRLPVTVFGYPANLSSGLDQYACRGRSGKRTLGRPGNRYSFLSIRGCGFGGGASGGPWLTGYRNKTTRGTIRTVSSFGPTGEPRYIAGPYFRRAVGKMLKVANGDFRR